MGTVIGLLVLLIVVVIAVVNSRADAPPARGAGMASEPVDGVDTLVRQPPVHELASPKQEFFRWASVAGHDALAAIPALDALGAREGWTAVFVGSKNELPGFGQNFESPDAVLARAALIDVPQWLARREQERIEDRLDDERDADGEEGDLLGEWSDDDVGAIAPEAYHVLDDPLTRARHERLYLALVPVREAWQVPAYLQNGGWNAVPDPAEQVAVLRYWHERHGARLRCFSDDVMEFDVARPPEDRDAALALAREQYVFCADLVEQGAGALRPLAEALVDSRRWFFWWD
jgi:hypothetical protein